QGVGGIVHHCKEFVESPLFCHNLQNVQFESYNRPRLLDQFVQFVYCSFVDAVAPANNRIGYGTSNNRLVECPQEFSAHPKGPQFPQKVQTSLSSLENCRGVRAPVQFVVQVHTKVLVSTNCLHFFSIDGEEVKMVKIIESSASLGEPVLCPVEEPDQMFSAGHDVFDGVSTDVLPALTKQEVRAGQRADAVIRAVLLCKEKGKTPVSDLRAPLNSIHTSAPMEFLTLDKSKGGVENVLVVTDHFSRLQPIFFDVCEYTDYVRDLRECLTQAYDRANHMSRKPKKQQKKHYDRKARVRDFQPGDRVLVKVCHTETRQKLGDRWEPSPYLVVKKQPGTPVYIVRKRMAEKGFSMKIS
ncbi:hypothetical protein NFI96_028844, partial [Prochilodus magdalenae]